jgi:hypothetical protein
VWNSMINAVTQPSPNMEESRNAMEFDGARITKPVIGLCEDGTVDDYSLFLASVYRVFILVLVAFYIGSCSDCRVVNF